MEFQNSQTFINLARSFAGESQAGMRYQLIAKQATAEGYAVLADNIRTIAKNETYHAKTFFNTILQNAGSIDNVDLQNAGYPFHFGTLEENLKFAAEDEYQILMLCQVAGYKRREVSEMLRLPVGTVTWKNNEALKKLKAFLVKEGGL